MVLLRGEEVSASAVTSAKQLRSTYNWSRLYIIHKNVLVISGARFVQTF